MKIVRCAALLLSLSLLLALCACGGQTAEGGNADTPGSGEPGSGVPGSGVPGSGVPETDVQVPTQADTDALIFDSAAAGNDFDAYLSMLDGMYRQGLYFTESGLSLQGEYMYRAGSAAAGSLRFFTECVLFLKGEGASLDEVTLGRFSNWDSLALLSPVSPYPDYFQGAVYQIQGMSALAEKYFSRAVLYPSWPEGGLGFAYMKMLGTDELYAIRDALLETEAAFFAQYEPTLAEIPRDPLNFHAEYLAALSREALEAGETELAAGYAKTCVMADPFSGSAFATAALMCLETDDALGFSHYVNKGLLIDPGHEGLNTLLLIYGDGGEVQQ